MMTSTTSAPPTSTKPAVVPSSPTSFALPATSARHDPYKEFELYLEKANEEIGAVFHQLEASSRARTATAPPAPPVRYPSNQLPPASKTSRPGLRVTDAQYVSHLPKANSSRARFDALGRRTSCPGFDYPNDRQRPPLSNQQQRPPINQENNNVRNRRLKRNLTLDSAAQFMRNDDKRHLASAIDYPVGSAPYHPNEIQLWTNGLMAECRQIIESELERLSKDGAHRQQQQQRPLSPWAKRQMAQLESGGRESCWSNDIELVEKQIFDDIVTLKLNQSTSGDSGAPSGQESNDSTAPDEEHVASPVLRPHELQDFLKRVEDSIRTPTEPTPPPTSATCLVPSVTIDDRATPTFDAGTQTSPTSLSRSSSFMWMSDCNCSGDLTTTLTNQRLQTPDSAAEIDDVDDDEEEEDDSSVSLSRSVDGGAGVESGIGTGSPPPRDRRRRPIPEDVAQTTKPTTAELSETSTCSSTEDERAPRSRASSACSNKKREKVRRRETWEKIRRRHPCKRVPSRANRVHKEKGSEVVWVRRAPPASPPPPPVPPHAVPLGGSSLPVMEPVLHKPPVVVIGSPGAQRPRPRPLPLIKDEPECGAATATSTLPTPGSLGSLDLTPNATTSPFLKVSRHLKPISASSTPTEPHITLEGGLAAARSHSESAFAELEATEACRWLRATGFPQYAQMYEDWQFPLDLSVVERDHPFLDVDSLHALFRRLATLNRMAKLRSEKARSRPQGTDETDEEDQECALSDQWTFQRHSRRWSRIIDLPPDPIHHSTTAPANTPLDDTDGKPCGPNNNNNNNSSDDTTMILGSFRRSSSERLRHGAKSLLKRMESLRSRSRRRPVRPLDGALVISGPQVQDAGEMASRVRDLNCVDLTPPDSVSPVSSTPSPDLNRAKSDPPEASPGVKMKRGFFQRRSFRPSASGSLARHRDAKETHSDSECNNHHQRSDSPWSNLEQSLRWKPKKSRDVTDPSPDSPPSRGKLHLNFSKSLKGPSSVLSSPDDDEFRTMETPSSGGHNYLDTLSTGTSGSHADSDYSPAASARTPAVRWHSFRRSSTCSSTTVTSQSVAVESLTVDQFAVLRKLALLRLTALLEMHTSSSKSSWGWDLPKFMRKTKSPDYKDKNMFGVPLSVTVQRTGEPLPRPVMAAMHYLRQSALDQVGLFRKSGVRSRIAKLKELCESWARHDLPSFEPVEPVDFSEHQPYDVADMIKQYFRELPEALMTNKLSETFVTIFQVVPVNQRLEAMRCAVLLLPDEHREALQTFLAFLTDVAALASINQMSPSNLAVCLAPSLFHLPATNRSTSTGSNGGANSTGSSPRRRKTVGVPDPRELSQNKAAHECLLQMIVDYRTLFTVPDELFRQCRCTYLDETTPVTLEDLRTVEYGDWQSYVNGCMAALLKETKEKSRGWESMSNDLKVDLAWKKVGDGHALRLWRVSTEVEAPPGELLIRVLSERHLWDPTLSRYRTVARLDKKSDVFHYTSVSEVPDVTRDVVLLRSWRTDLPRGSCLVVEMSIEHPDAAPSPGVVRSIVLASRYLIQPCGAGKCRLVHLSRVDIMGRSSEWYNKHYGHLSALCIARLRDSFSQHLVADGPESKV